MHRVFNIRIQGLSVFLGLLLVPMCTMAQQSVMSAVAQPEVRLGNDVRVTHTMGEPAVRRVEGDNQVLLTEGFQQGIWKLSLAPADQAGELHIYPNPAGSWVMLEFDEAAIQPEQVFIRNLDGTIINQIPVRHSGQYLDLSSLTPGQYVLQAIQSGGKPGPATPLIKH